MATPRIADQIGRVLGGRYRLVAPVGTGASAHVYLADDVRLGRRVAVKILHPALADDESFLRRFRAEANTVASLRHPHLMQVYDWGEDADGPYLVLEHLAGGSLRDLLDAGHRLSLAQAAVVGIEAARGLDHAHRRGLVHRDIKPANLLFDEEGRLAIADFGLARALAEAAWTEPAGAILGTARYASPEQARGSSVDGKADVYALALTLVEGVTGQVPFAADTTIATLMARLDRPLEAPPELGPLAGALEAAGTEDPGGRIDAAELARRLEDAAAGLPRAEPIPLAAPAHPATVDVTRVPRDLTVLGGGAVARSGVGPYDAEADPHHLGTAGGTEPVPVPHARSRTRRYATRALLALVLIGALGGGGVALAAATRPSYPVRDLRGHTLAEARRLVGGKEGFSVVEAKGTFYREAEEVGRIIGQSPLPEERLKEGRTIRVQLSDGPAPRTVPDLAGRPRAEVQQLLDGVQLVLSPIDQNHDTIAKDTVVDWSPKATLPRGGTVTVVFSKGPEPKPLPSFADRLYDEYVKALEALGLKAKKEEAFSDRVKSGVVITTNPSGIAVPGSEVTVVVSKGPEQVEVPTLSGLSEDDAAARLQQAGLRLGDRFGPPNKKVFASSPSGGTKVEKGSSVDVYTR